MTDVLLVHLPASWTIPTTEWCLTYRYLAAALRRAGFEAAIAYPPFVTDGTARRRLLDDVVERAPRIVGFTTYDPCLPALLDFVGDLRRHGLRAHVTLGGLCATATPEGILREAPGVDSVVRGEGEAGVVELADYVIRRTGRPPIPGVTLRSDDRIVPGPPRPFVDHLDDLPSPVWDDVTPDLRQRPTTPTSGYVPVTGSRGCYGRCSFCGIERFYRSSPHTRPWRSWSPARVADDVARATRATGAPQVTFVDENFIGPGRNGHSHAVQVAQQLRRRDRPVAFNIACRADDVDRETFGALKDAGLNAVTLGIESMSQHALDRYRKNVTPAVNARALALLSELGVGTEITYIFFDPLSTLEDVRQSLAFVSDVARIPGAYFNKGHPYTQFIPLAGTTLTGQLERLGHVRGSAGRYRVRYADPRVEFLARQVTAVPLDELATLRLAMPGDGTGRVLEIRERLAAYHRHLAMSRLPELLAQACDAFDAGAGTSDSRIGSVAAALHAETTTIRSLINRFLALLPVEEVHGGSPVPGDVLV